MTDSSRVGPVIFGNETAREQLLRGEVVTFRAGDRRTTGSTHARWERTGGKQADVHFDHITAIDPYRFDDRDDALSHYWQLSGFQSPGAWRSAIREHHGADVDGHVYYATLTPLAIVERLAEDRFDGADTLDVDVKPSAVELARVIDDARPGEPVELEARHVLDVMEASGGRVVVYCRDATDGKHWVRYRPWDEKYESYDKGPGIDDHSVVPRYAPAAWLDEHILTENVAEVGFVRPASTRFWEWKWAERLVVPAAGEAFN